MWRMLRSSILCQSHLRTVSESICELTLATFCKISIDSVTATVPSGDSMVSLDLPSGLSVDLSTLASRYTSLHLSLQLPTLLGQIQSGRQISGDIRLGFAVDFYQIAQVQTGQQDFLRKEDDLTRRVWYMYGGESLNNHHVDETHVPLVRASTPGERFLAMLTKSSTPTRASLTKRVDIRRPDRRGPLRVRLVHMMDCSNLQVHH
jgi:hypothetical protein